MAPAIPVLPRLAFVTAAALPNLYGEESELIPRLRARGVDAHAAVWSDPDVDWAAFDAVVIRSTWDYFERFEEFTSWLDRVERLAPICNPPALLRWNLEKSYLRDPAERGVRVVPSVFCAQGQPVDVHEVVRAQGWERVVMKPSVSGGAYRTQRFDASEASTHQHEADSILRSCGLLLQPFFPEIVTEGESSLLFFEGTFSHAVIKQPAMGDYRVQTQFGRIFRHFSPAPALLRQARSILEALPVAPAYARIDGVCRGSDFYLMEAELIEPYLFLAGAPDAMSRYVELVERLARSPRTRA